MAFAVAGPPGAPTSEAAQPGPQGRIAYLADGFPQRIRTINPDGSDDQPLTDGITASWSPDGKQLLVTDRDANFTDRDIWRVDANTGSRAPVKVGPMADSDPSWSPDGSRFVFTRSPQGIYTANAADGSDEELLVGAGGGPKFSPDGNFVVYSTQGAIVKINVHTKGVETLIEGNGDSVEQPDWSPDGSRIAFVRFKAIPCEACYELWVMDDDGSNPSLITAELPQVRFPSWSPDGTEIAVQVHTGETDEPSITCESCAAPQGLDTSVFIVKVVDGAARRLVTFAYRPDWSSASIIQSVEFTQAIQELQTLGELQSDLAGDGQPPVPIVADKPAAMRIYPRQLGVSEAGQYTVELSGQVNQVATRALTASCSPLERRAHLNNCSSVDFFFTPPVGAWSITLKVKNSGGAELESHTFNVHSVDTQPFTIKYVPICVALTSGALPTCPTPAVSSAEGLLKKLFPVADNELNYGLLPAPQLDYSSPVDMYVLRAKLRQDYEMMSQGGFVADQLAAWVPAGGAQGSILGLSDPLWLGGGRKGRVSVETDTSAVDPLDYQHTLAHEVGHNLGLRHTKLPDGCGAGGSSPTDWPYPDSTIQEVGFDVTAQPPVPVPDAKLDLMTYCSPPGDNIWVAPFDYTKLAHGGFQPQGNAATPESAAAGQYLVVRGSAQADGSSASINSAYVITSAQPAEPPHPMGNYCLHSTGGAQVDYCFLLTFQEHKTGEPLASEAFTVRIPMPAGTTRVSLGEGFNELDSLDASPAAPDVAVTQPDHTWSGEETIEWSASDADGDPLQFAVMYSPDGGETWLPLAVDTTGHSFSFDTSVLDGDQVLIRVLASDGLNTTTVTTGPVSVSHGTGRTWGDDNCDGSITLGDAIAVARFLVGLSVSQEDGCPAIGAPVQVDGADRTWGDLDCSGAASLADAITLARFLVGIVPDIAGCPTVGSTVQVQT
jgi:TolB protein